MYKRTPQFTHDSIPSGLRHRHSTKAGIWGRIVVEQGVLELHEGEEGAPPRPVTPSNPWVIVPEVEHRVAPAGEVAFHVELWKAAH